jgi:hypothetical protein
MRSDDVGEEIISASALSLEHRTSCLDGVGSVKFSLMCEVFLEAR